VSDAIITILALVVTLVCGWSIGSGRMGWRQYGMWLAVGAATYSLFRWGFDLGRWPAIVAGNIAVAIADQFYERHSERVKVDRVLTLEGRHGRVVVTFGPKVTPDQIDAFRQTWQRREESE
jgi:hypothetical protein